MPPLLTLPAVAQAVVDLSAQSGVRGVTARALANALHVSVGALYNYAGSMQHAVAAGEEILSQQIIDRLAGLPDTMALPEVLAWVQQNPGMASLYFDPARAHEPLPDQLQSRLGFTELQDPVGFEAVRSWVGLAIRSDHIDAAALGVDLESILSDYTAVRAEATSSPAAVDSGVVISQQQLDEELRLHATIGASSDREAEVRFHSAQVLIDPDQDGWNFRALSKTAGVALAALHAMGSRDHHLQQASIDLVSGIIRLNSKNIEGDGRWRAMAHELFRLLAPGLRDISTACTWDTSAAIRSRLGHFGCDETVFTTSRANTILAVIISAHHQSGTSGELPDIEREVLGRFMQRISR